MTLVDELRNELSRHEGVRLALLFGSRATGRFTASSDVDVAVDAPGVDTLGLAAALSQALGLEVDVLDLREAGYPILKRILHEGVVVFERDRWAAARWRTVAICRVETDRPWFERMRDAYLERLAKQASG